MEVTGEEADGRKRSEERKGEVGEEGRARGVWEVMGLWAASLMKTEEMEQKSNPTSYGSRKSDHKNEAI